MERYASLFSLAVAIPQGREHHFLEQNEKSEVLTKHAETKKRKNGIANFFGHFAVRLKSAWSEETARENRPKKCEN